MSITITKQEIDDELCPAFRIERVWNAICTKYFKRKIGMCDYTVVSKRGWQRRASTGIAGYWKRGTALQHNMTPKEWTWCVGTTAVGVSKERCQETVDVFGASQRVRCCFRGFETTSVQWTWNGGNFIRCEWFVVLFVATGGGYITAVAGEAWHLL